MLFGASCLCWIFLFVLWLVAANLWYMLSPVGESYIPLFLLAPFVGGIALITPFALNKQLSGGKMQRLTTSVRGWLYGGGIFVSVALAPQLHLGFVVLLVALAALGVLCVRRQLATPRVVRREAL